MNKKYLNFSIILIVLSVFDVITTQYALTTYPTLGEYNPIMALVTGSFALFVLVKAFFVMFIIGVYRRLTNPSDNIVKAGKAVIIMIMLFVVGNNLIQIASATTTYGVYTPNGLGYPGRVESDGSLTYAFIFANGSNIQEWGTTLTDWDTGISNAINNRMTGTTFIYSVQDWNNPYRLFAVASNKDVFYTDSLTLINWSTGYYDSGFGGCEFGGNCNDLHKIGVITTINTMKSGFVNSDGDLYLADGMTIVKFTKANDYTKSTIISASVADANLLNDEITSIAMDEFGGIHLLFGGSYVGVTDMDLYHEYYNASMTMTLEEKVANNWMVTNPNSLSSSLLISSNRSSVSKNIIFGYKYGGVVYLRAQNATATTDICPTSCGVITGYTGMQILENFAYISSSSENKIYRFPTTESTISGNGYVQGSGTESTDQPELTYTTKSINSLYANYYNLTKFTIQSTILFDSGLWVLGSNYGIDSQNYRWQIRLIDPNGVSVNSWDSSACIDSLLYGTCSLTILREYSPPSGGWLEGNWYVKLYEHKVGSSLVGAEVGNLALLTTSATWNVYNASVSANATGTIGDPTESISSPSNLQTISIIDSYVGWLGLGINSTSKLLFSLLFVVVLFVIGLIYTRNGNIGLALATAPYIFFTYIGYIEKWIFIIYIIMLIVISKVFR